MAQIYQAVQDVFDRTASRDPRGDSPDRAGLRDKVTRAVDGIIQRIHQISGTGDAEVYYNGRKPWNRP